jgi:hypothetical protein
MNKPTDIVRELRNAKQWCCIFEHGGHMRHGMTDAPFRAAEEIERLRALTTDTTGDQR